MVLTLSRRNGMEKWKGNHERSKKCKANKNHQISRVRLSLYLSVVYQTMCDAFVSDQVGQLLISNSGRLLI